MHFEASRVIFWSLSCYKEVKLTTKPFTGHTLYGLLIQMQNISLCSLGMHRKQNFAILLFAFSFPLFSLFFPHFFSLAGHLVGFILVALVDKVALDS